MGFALCLTCGLFPAKASSKEEPHSVPPAVADKLDGLPPPPEGAVADEGAAINAEILKNNLSEDGNFEIMDIHDEAAETEGKHSISIGLIDAVTSFVVFQLWIWLIT